LHAVPASAQTAKIAHGGLTLELAGIPIAEGGFKEPVLRSELRAVDASCSNGTEVIGALLRSLNDAGKGGRCCVRIFARRELTRRVQQGEGAFHSPVGPEFREAFTISLLYVFYRSLQGRAHDRG
jgi:hypothetical protein